MDGYFNPGNPEQRFGFGELARPAIAVCLPEIAESRLARSLMLHVIPQRNSMSPFCSPALRAVEGRRGSIPATGLLGSGRSRGGGAFLRRSPP